MKQKICIGLLAIGIFVISIPMQAAHFEGPRSGINVCCGYWDMKANEAAISVTSRQLFENQVNVGGYGGWITFFSRIIDQGYLEFSVGLSGRVDTISESLFEEEVHVSTVFPMLFGFRYHPWMTEDQVLQPFLSCGAGPYLMSQVHVIDRAFGEDEKVEVKSSWKPGVNFGAGAYFFMSNWFALDFDMRYHLVNFDPDHDNSGFAIGIGMGFFWGK